MIRYFSLFLRNLISKIANLSIDLLLELFYNLANGITKKRRLTALTDFLTNYKIVTELMFSPLIKERIEALCQIQTTSPKLTNF